MNRNYEEITRNRLLEQVETQLTDEKVEELMGLEKLLQMKGFIADTVAEKYKAHWCGYVSGKLHICNLPYAKHIPIMKKMNEEIDAIIQKYTEGELESVWYEIKDRIDERFEELIREDMENGNDYTPENS